MSLEGGAVIAAPVVLSGAAVGMLAVGGLVVLAGTGIAVYHLTRGAVAGTVLLAQAGYAATQANFRQIRHSVQQQAKVESGIEQLYNQAWNAQHQQRAVGRAELEQYRQESAKKRFETIQDIRTALRGAYTPITQYVRPRTDTKLDISGAVTEQQFVTNTSIYTAYDVSKMVQLYQQVLSHLYQSYDQLMPIVDCTAELKEIVASQKSLRMPASTIEGGVLAQVIRSIRQLELRLTLLQQKIHYNRDMAHQFERKLDAIIQSVQALPDDPSGMIQYLLQTISDTVQRHDFGCATQLVTTLEQEVAQLRTLTNTSLQAMFRAQFEKLRHDITSFSTLDYAPNSLIEWINQVNQLESQLQQATHSHDELRQMMTVQLKIGQKLREHMVQAIALRNQATLVGLVAHELSELGFPPDGAVEAQKAYVGRNGDKTVSVSVNENGELHFSSRGFGDGSCRGVYDTLMQRLTEKYGLSIHGDAYWTQKRTVDALIHTMIQQHMQVDVRVEHGTVMITAVSNPAISATITADGHATFSEQFTQHVHDTTTIMPNTVLESYDQLQPLNEQQRIRIRND